MKTRGSVPDFTALLQGVLNQLADSPTGSGPAAIPPAAQLHCSGDREPRFLWPQLEDAARRYAQAFTVSENVLGSQKLIGKARTLDDGLIETTLKPWEFQSWLPFASRRPVQLDGALVELEVEVMCGEIGVAVLGADGSHYVGERYMARIGRHRIQLPARSNDVKGVVFCNADNVKIAAHFRILDAQVLVIHAQSAAALNLKHAFGRVGESVPPETDRCESLEATAPLVIYHLLAHGRIHAARALLHASQTLTGEQPAWVPERLAEQLGRFDGIPISAEAPSPPGDSVTDEPSATRLERSVEELVALRTALRGAEIVPLHLELLEFGHALDLLGETEVFSLSCDWKREALASTPVPRGILTALLAVISDRLKDRMQGLKVKIETTTSGTTLWWHSGLAHGDLQYRAFTDQAAMLHQALNDARCAPPRIEHRLGEEGTLGFEWPDELAAHPLAALTWSTDNTPASTSDLYRNDRGGRIILKAGRCYKISPPSSSKANNLVQEAAILERLATCSFVPQLVASRAGSGGTAMSYSFEPGTTLAKLGSAAQRASVIRQLSDAVVVLNQLGIAHRDLRAENILVRPDGSITVLDFDQARIDPAADDFGNEWDQDDVCSGFGGLLRQLGWERSFVVSAGKLALAWEIGRHSLANSPGNHACYYDWQWGPLPLSGERPWGLRWNLLHTVFDSMPNGRFLELGCNLGLLSTYASLTGWRTHGIDRDELAVAAADLIASTLAADANFETGDLTSPDLFARLETSYDLVSALSVVHWLPDPAPVEDFLRRQPRLLFEGHRAIADEERYLHELGFDSVTLLGYSERLRPVLLAVRSS